MSAACVARIARAASAAHTLRGNASSAGSPIWNGRWNGAGDPARSAAGSAGLADGATGAWRVNAGETMVPAWPRVSR